MSASASSATRPASAPPTGIAGAIARTQQFLLSILDPRGYWECELVVDSTVASDYVLYYHWVGQPEKAQNERIQKHLLQRQLPDGGWPQFPGGPAELNATIKGYHALRLTGLAPDNPVLLRARACALKMGGIPKMHTFGKLYLALCGLFPWKYCPLIPAEMMLFPTWFPFHLYKMSSWTRNLVVPLAVINHFKPVRVLAACPSLDELYPSGSQDGDYSLPRSSKLVSWRNFFLACDKLGRVLNYLPVDLFRRRALQVAQAWLLARIGPESDGMGAIFPGQLNTLLALELLGLTDHPRFKKEVADFDGLVRGTAEDIRVAPCYSPVWDTAIIAQCLVDSGVSAADPRLVKVADWLLDREIKIKGDWANNVSFPLATGWAFEFNNDFYPDVDDTFQVILALRVMRASDEARRTAAIARSLAWCRAFQCKEGGYAAFDRDLTDPWLDQVPFADHNAILDPPCSDITGRALETLAKTGIPRDNPSVARALAFVRRTQEADGSWFGRWGVNYVYGTSHVLRGLALSGEDMTQPYILRARDWLEQHQNADGGWGESCWTYHDDQTRGGGPVFFPPAGMPGAANVSDSAAGKIAASPYPITFPSASPQPVPPNASSTRGASGASPANPASSAASSNSKLETRNAELPPFPSTASQTAWALLGLLACGNPSRPSVERGIQYLLDHQLPDGSWHYPWFTGTGFPRIFYLKYTSYQWAWPLLALTWYRNLTEGKGLPE
jgi:squalene-hopene/tetraprenyl-beta-curcumene cyclase